jgi:hypothetical protein
MQRPRNETFVAVFKGVVPRAVFWQRGIAIVHATGFGAVIRRKRRVAFGRTIANYPEGEAVNFNPVLEEQRG